MAARAAKVLAGSNPSAGTGEDENDPNKPPPAGRITVDLLRRRAEHNDGMIATHSGPSGTPSGHPANPQRGTYKKH